MTLFLPEFFRVYLRDSQAYSFVIRLSFGIRASSLSLHDWYPFVVNSLAGAYDKLLTHARSARCGCRDEFCVLQWEFPHFDRDLLHAESFQQIQRELIGKRLD